MEHDQPLSYFQLYMFDYQLYAPYTIMWNMPRAWKYARKDVDVHRLAAAYETVLAAHPVFRTVLRYDEDFELVQHYDETLSVRVPVEHVEEKHAADVLQALVQPFRLLNEPMYRAHLFETEESVYLFIDMHHIISDGLSMQVFSEHLTRAYEGEELPEDYYFLFMRDQHKYFLSKEYAEAKTYFERRYGGREWVRALTPEMESRETAFDRVVVPLGVEPEALEAYCAAADIGRNAFLQTVALLTVAYMENAENVMLGWVYHGRDDRKKEPAIGLLIKEIPLGLALGELPDLRTVYDSVKKQMSQGLANRDYPYLTIDSSAAKNDVFCFIDEGDILSLKGPGSFPCQEVPLTSTSAIGWLMALLFFNLDGIYMNMNFTPTRYHRETMERYCEIYRQLTAKILESRPETSVKDVFRAVT